MSNKLPPGFADKLAKILGMMGSAHDGEALAAAKAAHEMLKAAGAQWSDVIGSNAVLGGWDAALQFAHVTDDRLKKAGYIMFHPTGAFVAEDMKLATKIMSAARRKKPIAQKDLDRLDGMFIRYGGKH